MTATEVLMLAVGLTLGMQLSNLLHTYWAAQDARRAREQHRQSMRRAGAALYLSSFHVYRLQHRRTS